MQIRYSWLDSLRGLAIFLVVIGHVIQFLYCHDNDGYRKCIDWNIIYSFHMPLFFMISGYSYDICKDRFTIRKRAKQLLVPFAIWALINAIYNNSLYIWRLEYFIISPSNGGLWFLYALFFISVIYYLIDRISNRGGRIPKAIHNSLTFIGKNTIFIYLFHYYVIFTVMMPFMYDWFGKNGNIGIDILSVIFPTIVAVLFSLLVKRLLEYSPRLMKIIFYKS